MNTAVVDGSQLRDVGGWGVRLMTRHGHSDYRGKLKRVRSSAECELHAILKAVSLAPVGEALTVYTDADGMVDIVRRGTSNNPRLTALSQEIAQVADKRRITLKVIWKGREGRHQRAAHDLANAGRTGKDLLPGEVRVTALIATPALQPRTQVITLQRPDGRVTDEVNVERASAADLPLEALIALAHMLRAGEHCRVTFQVPSPLTQAYLSGREPRHPATRERWQQLRSTLRKRGAVLEHGE